MTNRVLPKIRKWTARERKPSKTANRSINRGKSGRASPLGSFLFHAVTLTTLANLMALLGTD